MVVDEVESTGTATLIDIQQTTQVQAGDQITAIGSSGELEYLALPDSNYDATSIVAKVHDAPGHVRLQLERPRQQVPSPLTFTLILFECDFANWLPNYVCCLHSVKRLLILIPQSKTIQFVELKCQNLVTCSSSQILFTIFL